MKNMKGKNMGQRKINVTVDELIRMYREGKTLQQIGDVFGVSRERIRQCLVRAGIIIRDERIAVKIHERRRNKALADAALIESTTKQMEELWSRTRAAEHRLFQIKKSRLELLKGFETTLLAIKELNQNPEIDKLINNQLEYFSQYRMANYMVKWIKNNEEKYDTRNE